MKPITDGVIDIKKYLESDIKIMWVLKEPYDDFDDEGNPEGGGWSMTDGFIENDKIKEEAKKISSWKLMAYTTYGIRTKCHYDDLPWISDEQGVIESLLGIAYVNISKMPGLTNSSSTDLYECYENWKKLLFKQIDIYNPDVIIFGGTIAPFWHDLLSNGITYTHSNGAIDVYSYKGKKMIDAYHPNPKKEKWEVYADSIINDLIKEG